MEAVQTQLRNVLELLTFSQTERVREWDRLTVQRAFQWAEYCEQLHSRFQSNPAVRAALEAGLSDTNRRLRDTLPAHSPVAFSDLAQCQHALLVHLLRNPYAPSSLMQVLFPDPKIPQEFRFDLSSLITCRSAFDLLCRARDRTARPGLRVEAEVRGKLLNAALTRAGTDERARSVLDSVLRDSAGEMERLYDIIAAALLSGDDESNAVTARVILAWLQHRDGALSDLCRALCPGLCALLSRRSPEFNRAYRGVLKQWASCLEYDVLESVWVPTSEGPVTFNALTDRFRDLINAGAALKEDTERELRALTLADGDFDEQGISVWTDLTTRLNTGRFNV